MSDRYEIHINMPIQKGSLISEIKSLTSSTSQSKKKRTEQETGVDTFTFSSVAKKKEKKKKKKKGLDLEFMTSGEVSSLIDFENSEEPEESTNDNLIDIDEIFNRDEDDDYDEIGEGIIGEQRRGYDRLKKEENPYKKEFAEELTLLYNLLDEVNKFGKELEKKYKGIENSRARGVSKYTNDLIISILQSKSGKLSIMKEIASIKKTIADLKIKEDGKNKSSAANGPQSTEFLAASYFQNVLKYGRNNFIKNVGGNIGGLPDDEEEYDDLVSQIEAQKKGYNNDELDLIDDLIDERLEEGENPFRTNNGSQYIKYENRGVKIYIKKCIDTGEWEFIALDLDKQQINDYPLPSRRDVGKMKFSSDGKYASDERGRTYNVFEYFSQDED